MNTVSFTKIHMELPRSSWAITDRDLGEYSYQSIEKPEYQIFRKLSNMVGKPYGWHLRPRTQDREFMESILHHERSRFFIFKRGVEEIGFCFIEKLESKNEIEISDFGFKPELTGKGLGKIFFPSMVDEAFYISEDIKKVVLTTRNTNNKKVPDFYKKFGFEITGYEDKIEEVLEPDKYSNL